MREMPLAVLERIMRKTGSKRISTKALLTIQRAVIDYVADISRDAIMFAKHANRVTVLDSDVRLALRKRE